MVTFRNKRRNGYVWVCIQKARIKYLWSNQIVPSFTEVGVRSLDKGHLFDEVPGDAGWAVDHGLGSELR